jgi:hypothetical protein
VTRFGDKTLFQLKNESPLAFALMLKDKQPIATVGEAASFFANLSEEQRETSHWRRAILMLNNAMKEPRYLATATVNLQTALSIERMLLLFPPSEAP